MLLLLFKIRSVIFTNLVNFGFADFASLELGITLIPLVRVEPVLLSCQKLVLVQFPAPAFSVVARASLPRIGNDNLKESKTAISGPMMG